MGGAIAGIKCSAAKYSALRAHGHGCWIDDAGGYYWIGHEALKRVLRRSDEQGDLLGSSENLID